MDDWGWSQWTMAGLCLWTAVQGCILDGRQVYIKGWSKVVDAVLVATILYFGKFWQ